MRAIATIIAGLCLAGGAPAGIAHAADLPVSVAPPASAFAYSEGVRMGSIVLFDDQPGVVVRAYWQRPWRNRHYFPRTGKRPRIGRAENLAAPRRHYTIAESYHRAWSTNALFPPPVAAPVPVSKPPVNLK